MQEVTEAPRMDIILPKLSKVEVLYLATWATQKLDTFKVFAPWLRDLLVEEVARRDFADIEPQMQALPEWNGLELADAVMGSYCLSHFALNELQAKFVDQLHMFCLASACSALQHHLPEVKL